MKFVTAQLNYTVGAIESNASKIISTIDANASADWIIFTELCISGYYPMDLVNVPGFFEAQNAAVASIVSASKGIQAKVVVGLITQHTGSGKPWYNSLAIISDGALALTYDKQLLPTYDVFDERRHFEPGHVRQAVWREAGKPSIGFIICEDGWNDEGDDYVANPTASMDQEKIDILVSINASPAAQKKPMARESLMTKVAIKYGWSMIYVNQVGGSDALVFDGNTFVCNPDGTMAYRAPAWVEDVHTVEYDATVKQFKASTVNVPSEGPEEWHSQIVLGIRDYFKKSGQGFTKALIGSSGGIDSAVVMALAVDALGPDNVVALTMPYQYSSEGSINDSITLSKNLGMQLYQVPIQAPVDAMQATFETTMHQKWDGIALQNAQARTRGMILMGWSNQLGALVLSTGNKSEMSVGYATLYGDMNGAINPLGDLYKMEVYALAKWLNVKAGFERIPQVIIDKEPSAELGEGQKDTDNLPPYPLLDAMLKLEIEGHLLSAAEKNELEAMIKPYPEERRDVLKKLEIAEFKRRQAPPIIRVHPRAFGAGWQFPVAQQYRRWTRI